MPAQTTIYLLHKLKRLRDELSIAILAYCLMPNHYHLVVRQDGDVPVSTLVQRAFQTYTQAFNRQQVRRGPLLEGRFRHVHVDRDEYAVHLCGYLHLNPVAAGLVAHPTEWPYSNYREWIEARPGTPRGSCVRQAILSHARRLCLLCAGPHRAGTGACPAAVSARRLASRKLLAFGKLRWHAKGPRGIIPTRASVVTLRKATGTKYHPTDGDTAPA
ncbi:MAG: transposase [Chloroflexi bacterium]|nr:transposase [Chloroflexota bacterium]MBU1750634.1 transposase [Chloroflexota bacterium]MBU1880125.1 transposase [Chloroflexota bacterium]